MLALHVNPAEISVYCVRTLINCRENCDCLCGEELCRGVCVCVCLSSAGLSCQSVFDSLVSWSSPVDREVALRNSPSKLVPQLKLSSSGCHIIVAVAENDSPEFRKQSEEYYKVSAADEAQTPNSLPF